MYDMCPPCEVSARFDVYVCRLDREVCLMMVENRVLREFKFPGFVAEVMYRGCMDAGWGF